MSRRSPRREDVEQLFEIIRILLLAANLTAEHKLTLLRQVEELECLEWETA